MEAAHAADPASEVRAPVVRTAAALEADARRDGFLPGFPPALSRVARYADLTAFRRSKCPACASRMAAKPFHRPGAEGYRLVLCCGVCGAGESA